MDDRNGSMKAAGDGPEKTGDAANLKHIKLDAVYITIFTGMLLLISSVHAFWK